MRLISIPEEQEDQCPVCEAQFAWVYTDMVEKGPDKFIVQCPNCGRTIEVWPSEKFIRKFIEHKEELSRIRY